MVFAETIFGNDVSLYFMKEENVIFSVTMYDWSLIFAEDYFYICILFIHRNRNPFFLRGDLIIFWLLLKILILFFVNILHANMH